MRLYHPDLLADMRASSTTLTDLLLVGPLPDATYRGFTLLDTDVTYDSGGGARTYKARTGWEMSALQATSDLGVDNAEANVLPPIAGFEIEGFTQAQIDSGALDKVPFVVYRVNYRNLATGRHGIVDGGTIGEVRRKVGNLTVLELRSLSNQLKQNIVELDSRTCRAPFGSVTGVDARQGCDFDLTDLWVTGTVLAVGGESDREFTDTSLTQAADYFAPGVVEWLTGDNAGQQREVEAFGSGEVALLFPTVNPISMGDTFRIRPDCTKYWTGHNSCDTWWASAKTLHFRGEPWIPVGQSAALNVPGADTGPASISIPQDSADNADPTPSAESPPTIVVGTDTLNVDDYGAVGDGTTDDTAAWNAAIAALPAGGGTVHGTSGKTYLIDAEVSVKPKDNTYLDLTGITLQAKTTSSDAYAVILCDLVDNVEIAHGTIIGERDTHTGVGGEQGHCIRVKGSTNISIHHLTLQDGWGDGVVVGPNKNHSTAYVYSENVYIANCTIDNNRRNGISAGNVLGCQILNNTIKNTNGTSPQCGIDVEPDGDSNGVGYCGDVLISGNDIFGNAVYGINVFTRARDVTISGNTIHANDSCGVVVSGAQRITVTGNTIYQNDSTGLFFQNEASNCSASGNTFYQNHGESARGTAFDQTGTSSSTTKDLLVGPTCTAITIGSNHYE